MPSPSRQARAGLLVLIVAVLLMASPAALAWREHTHKNQLTPLALDLVAQHHAGSYPDEIWLACRPFIMQGAWDEDFPCGLEGIRANNHYCHPLTRHGLSDAPWAGLGDPDVCTLAWALENASFSPDEEFAGGEAWGYAPWGWNAVDVGGGDMSWRRAVERYGYTEESRRLAYYTLGFACHLLQDMGNPEHVHDDPHGASGYTGFEWWVWRHWDSLAPAVPGELTPRKFDTLEAFLENLALLGYSAGRFHGGELSKDKPYIDPGTDLAKMFRVRGVGAGREWQLRNPDGRAILGWSSPGGGTNVLNRRFEWNPGDYRDNPLWTKGHDQGEWWPTSVEIPGSDHNDAPGYYYIELSGELPGEPFGFLADPGRSLYPAAFLPTPLPQVADQCAGWRTEDAAGEHLYSLVARCVFPLVVEHTAGLIEHFHDVVNPPPFVRSVEVAQPGGGRYAVQWQDRTEPIAAGASIVDVVERTLIAAPAAPAAGDTTTGPAPDAAPAPRAALAPGAAGVRIVFSEPVRDVVVTAGGRPVPGALDESGAVWTGALTVEPEGPPQEDLILVVEAEDKHAHFGNTGARLDGDPATPARRLPEYPAFPWTRYEAGADSGYSLSIRRDGTGGGAP